MQMHDRVGLQKLGDSVGFVGREVIGNDVNLLHWGLTSHAVRQEGGELLGGVSAGRLAEY